MAERQFKGKDIVVPMRYDGPPLDMSAFGKLYAKQLLASVFFETPFLKSALLRARERREGAALAAALIPNWDARWRPLDYREVK